VKAACRLPEKAAESLGLLNLFRLANHWRKLHDQQPWPAETQHCMTSLRGSQSREAEKQKRAQQALSSALSSAAGRRARLTSLPSCSQMKSAETELAEACPAL